MFWLAFIQDNRNAVVRNLNNNHSTNAKTGKLQLALYILQNVWTLQTNFARAYDWTAF